MMASYQAHNICAALSAFMQTPHDTDLNRNLDDARGKLRLPNGQLNDIGQQVRRTYPDMFSLLFGDEQFEDGIATSTTTTSTTTRESTRTVATVVAADRAATTTTTVDSSATERSSTTTAAVASVVSTRPHNTSYRVPARLQQRLQDSFDEIRPKLSREQGPAFQALFATLGMIFPSQDGAAQCFGGKIAEFQKIVGKELFDSSSLCKTLLEIVDDASGFADEDTAETTTVTTARQKRPSQPEPNGTEDGSIVETPAKRQERSEPPKSSSGGPFAADTGRVENHLRALEEKMRLEEERAQRCLMSIGSGVFVFKDDKEVCLKNLDSLYQEAGAAFEEWSSTRSAVANAAETVAMIRQCADLRSVLKKIMSSIRTARVL